MSYVGDFIDVRLRGFGFGVVSSRALPPVSPVLRRAPVSLSGTRRTRTRGMLLRLASDLIRRPKVRGTVFLAAVGKEWRRRRIGLAPERSGGILSLYARSRCDPKMEAA